MPEQIPTNPLLHIVSADHWRHQVGGIDDGERRGSGGDGGTDGYVDPSLRTEGFIHCSTPSQVLIPANERFAGRRDLLLLVVDEGRLSSPVRYEDCCRSGLSFPHIYGPIDWEAIAAVLPFPYDEMKGFRLPPVLGSPTE